MHRFPYPLVCRAGLLVGALAFASCAAAPATTLLSPAISGLPAVSDFIDSGASESFWVARYDSVVVAARNAGAVFALETTRDDETPERTLLEFADRAGETIRLRIEPRTDALTFVRFGGKPGMMRLMGRQIGEELNAAKAFLVDWDGRERGAFAR